MKRFILIVSAIALCAVPAMGGEWHTGTNNLCTDCHTMHFSQTHTWDGTGSVSTTPAADGNWLSTTGPNHYLLKAPANELCLSCHDGQTFAPDVYGTNGNVGGLTEGRMAGALNGSFGAFAPGAGYTDISGHTLETTDRPPGYDPTLIGGGDPFPAGAALECLNCHLNHGIASSYRNLGPRSWGAAGGVSRPSYEISTTQPGAGVDVWINIDPAGYTPNSGNASDFNPYYDYANIFYLRNDTDNGTVKTSNTMDTFCAGCHGTFHGGPGDAGIGGIGTPPEEFVRHPTSWVNIGDIGGGHSRLSFYTDAVAAGAAVKVYTNDYTAYTGSSPGCVSCHKAHGNQNPFGLFFLSPNAATIDEEGGDHPTLGEMPNGYGIAYMGMCGQCHTQGINVGE